ncbi:unnamed protein product [Sphagnum balticum]
MFKNLFGHSEEKGDPITNAHEKFLAEAHIKGRNLSTKLKSAKGPLELHVAPIRAQYARLASEHTQPFGGDHAQRAQSEKEYLTKRSEQLATQLEKARETERTLELGREQLPKKQYKSRNKKLLWAVIILLAFGDALVTKPALEIFSINSNVFQFLMLIVLTGIFVIIPHGIVGTFRASENSKYKMPIRLVALGVLLFGLFTLANMRSIFLQNIGDTTMDDVKAVSVVEMKICYFIGLNLFFLFASTYCVFLLGTDTENESYDKAKEIDARLAEIRAEIKTIEAELEQIPYKIYTSEHEWSEKQAGKESLKNLINSLFLQSASAFISECLLYSTLEDRPAFFDEPNLSIEPEYAIFSNANQRIGMLKRFKERIKDVFARAKKNYQGTQNQSVVYVTVVSEANKIMALNLGDDGQRYMVIYSDLLDHDETLDLYNPVILNAVVNHPEQVMKSMESVLKVGNLKGLKILILFQSNDHDIAEDRHFNISSHFYQRLFTAHGAEVVIAGNLQSMN